MKTYKDITTKVFELYKNEFGREPDSLNALPISGSDRRYFRLPGGGSSVIAAYNPIIEENVAFIEFTKHFHKAGLPVPEIICVDDDKLAYLITDLGDKTLFSTLPNKYEQVEFSKETINTYKKVLKILPEFQVKAGKSINYDVCFPRKYFDKQSIMWDLNYFKYYFLKVGGIAFNEQKLENCFLEFTNLLSEAESDFFMYRDFQSRNIMLVDNEPWFIDYQGGRKGALQYDVASLLYDAKANMPFSLREELLNYYINVLKNHLSFDEEKFRLHYYAFVLVRVFQAMGAYGFRGFIEKKPVFLQSVPYAINNLEYLYNNKLIPHQMKYFDEIIKQIINSNLREKYRSNSENNNELTVRIFSFSYKKGIPDDLSGNGGGFIFDCRALPNPGREEKYKTLCGLDKEVVDYLDAKPEVERFLNNTVNVAGQSVENYLSRGFYDLMISFGCTGGQHRSVYCAEKTAKLIRSKYNVRVDIEHVDNPV